MSDDRHSSATIVFRRARLGYSGEKSIRSAALIAGLLLSRAAVISRPTLSAISPFMIMAPIMRRVRPKEPDASTACGPADPGYLRPDRR